MNINIQANLVFIKELEDKQISSSFLSQTNCLLKGRGQVFSENQPKVNLAAAEVLQHLLSLINNAKFN